MLLKDDALLTTPPASTWFAGRTAIASFFRTLCFSAKPKHFRMLPTRANGRPTCAAYEWDPDAGDYRFSGLMVLRIEGALIAEVTGFGSPALSGWFGLPSRLGPEAP